MAMILSYEPRIHKENAKNSNQRHQKIRTTKKRLFLQLSKEANMSDFKKYKNKRIEQNPDFFNDYEKRFDTFKLGVLLKQARQEAGLTQKQIADQLHTSKSVISRMENHAKDIRLSTLEKFAKAVGRDIQVALV